MKRMLTTIGTASALGAIVLAGQPAIASEDHGAASRNDTLQLAHVEHHSRGTGKEPGMMGRRHGHGMMMGHGSGPHGLLGYGKAPCAGEKNFSADDVKNILEGRLAWYGNKRLKVGEVKKKDDDTYIADIVTADDSLVERLEVDRKTGATRRAE